MAKVTQYSCAICLQAYDPDDFIEVSIPHAKFEGSSPAKYCRRCVVEIIKAGIRSELIDPREVLGDDAAGDNPSDGGASAPPGAEAAPPVVPEDQPGAEPSAVDRREPEVPAGGEADDRRDKEG